MKTLIVVPYPATDECSGTGWKIAGRLLESGDERIMLTDFHLRNAQETAREIFEKLRRRNLVEPGSQPYWKGGLYDGFVLPMIRQPASYSFGGLGGLEVRTYTGNYASIFLLAAFMVEKKRQGFEKVLYVAAMESSNIWLRTLLDLVHVTGSFEECPLVEVLRYDDSGAFHSIPFRDEKHEWPGRNGRRCFPVSPCRINLEVVFRSLLSPHFL